MLIILQHMSLYVCVVCQEMYFCVFVFCKVVIYCSLYDICICSCRCLCLSCVCVFTDTSIIVKRVELWPTVGDVQLGRRSFFIILIL